MKLVAAVSLFVLGCGAVVPTAPAPVVGCPSATELALAQWLPRQVVGTTPDGLPRAGGWLVRLGFRPADAADAPPLGALQGYDVAKLALGPLPDPVWVLRPGVAPCQAHVTGYAAVPIGDVRSVAAILDGCAAAADEPAGAEAWISLAGTAPKDCRLETPAHATSDDALPSAWEAGAPTEPCDGCTRTWAVDAIDGAPAIDAVTVTDRGATDTACADTSHDGYAIYATAKDATPQRLPVADALDLVGALVDLRGTRTILAAGADTWATLDVGADGVPVAGRTIQYFRAPDGLGPRHTRSTTCLDE